MKKLYTTISLLAGVFAANAQNLVTNYSFEAHTSCPNNYNQVALATGWFPSSNNNNPQYHTEYLHACGTSMFSSPSNTWGFQAPATGQGYMAIVTLAPPVQTNYRENIYTTLTSPLVVGATYNVSFKISSCDNAMRASNNFGVKFSTVPDFPINNIAHINNANVVTDKINWTTVSGTFIADSAYTYICLGNFMTDANTTQVVSCPSCSFVQFCYYLDDVEVTAVSAPPTASFISNVNSVCVGQPVSFANTSVNATAYSWNFGDMQTSTLASPTHTYNTPGVFTVTLIATNGVNNDTATSTITVHPAPVVTASGSDSICPGDTVILFSSGAQSYFWTPSASLGSPSSAATAAYPQTTTTYLVTGTNSFGCTASATVQITVVPLPVLVSSVDDTICSGDSLFIASSGASTYSWLPAGTVSSPFSAGTFVDPTTTTTYTVTGSNSLGCSATDSVTVIVAAAPDITASTKGDSICTGFATTIAASGAQSYTWQPGNMTGSLVSVSPATTTTYTITGTSIAGCIGTATVQVVVNSLPNVSFMLGTTTVCVDDQSFLLTGGLPSGGLYTGSGVSGGMFYPDSAGTGNQLIVYSYTDSNGCTNTAGQNIQVDPCVGIAGNIVPEIDFTVLPNPGDGHFALLLSGKVNEQFTLQVYDTPGKLLKQLPVKGANRMEINLSELPAGVYYLKITGAGASAVKRVIIR